MKKNVTRLYMALFSIAALLLPIIIFAQDPGEGPDGPTVGAPFDGGLTLIAVAGAGYAIKKARDKRKQKNEADF